jgi:hypothetical protein
MIVIAPKQVEWASEDASKLREFLNSQTGHRVMQVLAMGAPELLDGDHKNKTLVSAGRLTGYQMAIETMFRLTYENPNENAPVAAPAGENYQSLDDDAAWKDIDSQVDKLDEKTTS